MITSKLYISKIKRFAGNELIYIGSDILIKAIAFVSMPFFLNVMTTEDFGAFNLYMTYKSVFAIFMGLNVSSAIVRHYVERRGKDTFLATAIWIVVVGSLIFSSLILSLNKYLGLTNLSLKILIIILISTAFTCLGNIGRELLRSEKNAILYGLSSIINSILSTLIGLILVYTMIDELAFWRIVSVMIATGITGGILTLRIIYKDGVKGDVATAKYLLSYSVPLIPYTLSTTVLAHVNKLFLARISLSDVGIYSFAMNLAMIIYIIAIALNRSIQPRLFELLRDNKDFKYQLKRSLLIFYFFYLCFIFGTDILMWIFGNESYFAAGQVIPILLLAYGYFYLYSLYVNFMYYYKKNFTVSIFSIISAAVAILSNLILIEPFGFIGAAIATLISYFVLFIMGALAVSLKLKIQVFNLKTIFLMQICLIIPVIIKLMI